MELDEVDQYLEAKRQYHHHHHLQPTWREKVTQARTALSEAIGLSNLQDPKEAALWEIISTLNNLLHAQDAGLEYHQKYPPGYSEMQKELKTVHQKLDLLVDVRHKEEKEKEAKVDKPINTLLRPSPPISSTARDHSPMDTISSPTYADVAQRPAPPIKQTNLEIVIPQRNNLNLEEYINLEADSRKTQEKENSQPWIEIKPRKKQQKQNIRISRERRLILTVPLDFLDSFNPKYLRDSINDEFLKMGKEGAVVAGITKSMSNLSLIITTLPNIQAQYLIEHIGLWKHHVPILRHSFDQKWARVVVHRVPWRPFAYDDGLMALKDGIETFNSILRLIREPQWLKDEETRQGKLHTVTDQPALACAEQSGRTLIGYQCKVTQKG